jgi:hypothetical protein
MSHEISARDWATLRERRWTADDARVVLAAWRASGLSRTAFCEQRGLGVQRLHYWSSVLGGWAETREGGASDPGFVPAMVLGPRSGSPEIVLHLASGLSLEVHQSAAVAPEWIAAVVASLARST